MKLTTHRTREALLLMNLALPAVAQYDGPTASLGDPKVALQTAPQKAYSELRGVIETRQKAGIAGIEKFHGSSQLLVGSYPKKFGIRERSALSDNAYDAAVQIGAKDQQNATRWINFPPQDSITRSKLNLGILQLAKKETFLVVDDPFERAVALDLLKVDGTSAVPVDAPLGGGSPFDTVQGAAALERASLKHLSVVPGGNLFHPTGNEWYVEEIISFTDQSTISRPEIVSGELKGRGFAAGVNGLEDCAGLTDLKGEVTKTTNKWNPDYAYFKKLWTEKQAEAEREYRRLEKEVKAIESRLSPAEFRLQQKSDPLKDLIERCSSHNTLRIRLHQALQSLVEVTKSPQTTAVQGRAFIGPVGSKAPQNSEEFLGECQKLIETEYRERCAKILIEGLGDGKAIFGPSPDNILALLAIDRMKPGNNTKSAPLRNLAEVKAYISDLAFGLTDDAVPDLRRLSDDMLSRAKGESERTQWRTVMKELDRVVPEVQALRKADPYFPEARRIDWSRFNISIPLEIVVPGMLYERLRVD